jgi:hypothetical protein
MCVRILSPCDCTNTLTVLRLARLHPSFSLLDIYRPHTSHSIARLILHHQHSTSTSPHSKSATSFASTKLTIPTESVMESQNAPPSVDENAWFDQGMIVDYFQNLQEENTQLRKESMATKAQMELGVFGAQEDFGNIMNCYNEINDLNVAQRQLQAEIAETEKLKKAMERSLWTPRIPDIELKKEDDVSGYEYQTVIKNMGELLRRFGEIERQFHEIKKGFHDTTKDLADNLALISKEYLAVYQRLEQVESSKAVTAAVTDAALAELQLGTAALMLNEDGYFSRIMVS